MGGHRGIVGGLTVRHHALILLFVVVEISFSQPVLYPLDPGNRWQFAYPPGGEGSPMAPLRVVCDTILPNGKHYAAIQYNDPWTTKFERISSDSVFAYETSDGQEHLLYHFAGGNGDTVSTYVRFGWDTTDVILQDTATSTWFWGPKRIWRFLIDVRQMFDEEESITIADSLGVVGVSNAWGYYCTLQGAVINGRIYGIIAGVRASESVPATVYSLDQNYPNPFNPSTTIRYGLPSRSHVDLTVYNTLGQQVATLVQGEQEAGFHEAVFDASGLASGVYVYRLQSGETILSRKMVLVH